VKTALAQVNVGRHARRNRAHDPRHRTNTRHVANVGDDERPQTVLSLSVLVTHRQSTPGSLACARARAMLLLARRSHYAGGWDRAQATDT
jgi:hypothetical protein